MGILKTDNPDVRNVELIQTYYPSSKKTTAEKNIAGPRNKKRSLSYKQIVGLASLIIFSVPAGYYIRAKLNNLTKNNETITLLPIKQYSNISYYSYKQIEKNAAPIVLGVKNRAAAINFDGAVDLSKGNLYFTAKGKNGTEKIAIILKDNSSISNANRNDAIITSLLPQEKWQTFNVALKDASLPLNKSRITQIRFDASTNLTDNYPDADVYIKKIYIEFTK